MSNNGIRVNTNYHYSTTTPPPLKAEGELFGYSATPTITIGMSFSVKRNYANIFPNSLPIQTSLVILMGS